MTALGVLAMVGLGAVLPAPASVFSTDARTELRLRGGQALAAEGQSGKTAWDFDAAANAGVAFDWHRTRLALVYSPRLVFTGFTKAGSTRDLSQAASLGLTFRSEGYTLTLSQRGEYGNRRFNSLDRSQVDPRSGMLITNTVPGPTSVRFVAIATRLDLQVILSRRSTFNVGGGYSLAGGANAESRRTIPRAAGPQADMGWNYALSLRDNVGLTLTGLWLRSSGVAGSGSVNTGDVTLGQRWGRVWTRTLRSEFSLGETLLFTQGRSPKPYPLAFATLTGAFPGGPRHGMFDWAVGGGTAVAADQLTGTARANARTTAQLAWTSQPVKIYAVAGFQKSLSSEDNAASVFTADTGISYEIVRPLLFDIGLRTSDQLVSSPTLPSAVAAPSGFAYAVFCALTWRPLAWPLS